MDIKESPEAFEIDQETSDAIAVDRAKGDFRFPENHKFDAGYGLNKDTIDYISNVKKEKDWIREFRHKALDVFESKPMPTNWATDDLDNIDFDAIRYYLSDGERPKRSWDDVPDDVKETFERLGIPEQERAFLAGVEAQLQKDSANTKRYSAHILVRLFLLVTTSFQLLTLLYSQEVLSFTSLKE